MEKVALVTGGAGFIGSNLCDELLLAGCNVICVDNLITGAKNNIVKAFESSQFTFIEHDVTQKISAKLPRLDYIFHLASPASVVDYQRYPEETALVNSLGTINMLNLAKDNNAKFLFASTSEVYGDPKEHPQKETYWGNVNPIGVRACYDESKRFGEMMTMLYIRQYNLDARIIRIFNTYGPRMRKTDGRVVSNFINQAISGKPLTVYGDGSQTRSFCFVSDLVDGILKAMNSIESKGEVINLGNPEEYRVIDLARKIKEMTASPSPIIHASLPEDDPTQRRPDITKAQKLLRWEPKVPLDDGLRRTIEYFQQMR